MSLLPLLVALVAAAPGPARPQPRLLGPAEIVKRIEASPVKYSVRSWEEFGMESGAVVEAFWPSSKARANVAVVTTDELGRRGINELKVSPPTQRLIDEAEKHYAKGDFSKAAEGYRQAIATDPSCPLPWLFLGDCLFHQDDVPGAIEKYRKAVALNRADYRPHFFLADALLRAGKVKESRDEFAWALVLNPRYEHVLDKVRSASDRLGTDVQPDLLAPRAYVRKTSDGIDVFADADSGAHWVAYGFCKALWLGEPSHRKEMTGKTEHRFSIEEERECLGSLLAVYEAEREHQRTAGDPFLDRLVKIARAGLLDAFIVYELASRVLPYATLLLDEAAREKVKRFVIVYVMGASGA